MDLQPGCEAIHNYMYEVNLELCRLKQEMTNMDVLEVSAVVTEVAWQCLRCCKNAMYEECYSD